MATTPTTGQVVKLADRRRPSPRQVDPNLHVETEARPGQVVLEFTFPDGTKATAHLDPEPASDLAEVIAEAAKDARAFAGKDGGR